MTKEELRAIQATMIIAKEKLSARALKSPVGKVDLQTAMNRVIDRMGKEIGEWGSYEYELELVGEKKPVTITADNVMVPPNSQKVVFFKDGVAVGIYSDVKSVQRKG